MIGNSTTNNRYIIPKDYLSSINQFSATGDEGFKATNPVCISMEPYSFTIEDAIDQIDFSAMGRSTKKTSGR
jgi:hypothetical protein